MAVDPDILREFYSEAREHLSTVEEDILALEKGEGDAETVNHLFRALHTVKGGAGFLGLQRVTGLAHVLENVVGKLRAGSLAPSRSVSETLLRGVDKLKALIDCPDDDTLQADDEIQALERIQPPQVTPAAPGPAPAPRAVPAAPVASAEVSPSEARTPSAPPESVAIRPPSAKDAPRSDSTVRISVALLDKLMNLASELVLVRNQNAQAVVSEDIEQLTAIAQRLNVVTSELQASVMQTRMRPIGTVFGKFNRIARDLARNVHKEVDLEVLGADVELDKNIIEAIGDPLTHLIRNAIDHGLEAPAEREQRGKPRRGRIVLSAYHRAGQVNIRIEDDGRGMDPTRILEAALEKGLVSRSQADQMTERDSLNLVFMPGFSMAERITDLSGRGVGMDVVKEAFGKFGGAVDIASRLGLGTTITIKLPLTLAIVPALIVSAGGLCFAIPQVNIDEVVWLHGDNVYQSLKLVDDQEVYWLRGKLLPILRLSKVLDLRQTYVDPRTGEERNDRRAQRPDRRGESEPPHGERRRGPRERRTSTGNSVYIVVIKLGEEQFGLLVDSIVDTEEIVVKALHDQLKSSGAFAGTTVLGDGRIAMIVDVTALVELGGLRFGKIDTTVGVSRSSSEDQQTVLLFDIGGKETFAVPLCLITRVEEVHPDRAQWANDREYLPFRDGIIPIVRMEQAIVGAEARYGEGLRYVIVPKCPRPIGILAGNILDTVQIAQEIDSATITSPGIVGSTILGGKLTLFVDLFQIIENVEPGWLNESNLTGASAPRVLLVEDSAFYAALIAPQLRNAGLEVVHAHNGEEGLKRLGEQTFDFVVSDLEMPVVDGFEFARRVRSDLRLDSLSLLAISSMSDPSVESRALKAGFDEFQSKLDHARLMERLLSLAPGQG